MHYREFDNHVIYNSWEDWDDSPTPYKARLNDMDIDLSTANQGKNAGDKIIPHDFSYLAPVDDPYAHLMGAYHSAWAGTTPVMTVVKNGLKKAIKSSYLSGNRYHHRDLIVEYNNVHYYACSKFFFLVK